MTVGGKVVVVSMSAVVVLASCASKVDQSGAPSSATGMNTASSVRPHETSAKSDQYESIAGTHVSLKRLAGLIPDPTLPGLARPGSRASIVVLDEGRPPSHGTPQEVLTHLDRSFRDEGRAARTGLELAEPRLQQIAGYPGLIVTGTQTQSGQSYDKALAAIATEDSTVLMNATIERGDARSAAEALNTLIQARWNAERAPHDFGFSLTAAPGYEQGPSSALMYGLSGTDSIRFTASPSSGTAPPSAEHRESAEQRFRQLPGNPEPTDSTETDIAGYPSWEVTGQSAATTFYAAMVFTPDGYILLTGSQPKGWPDQLAAFRQMAHSLHFQN